MTGEAPEGALENRIDTSLAFLRSRLGFEIASKEVQDILGRLGFEVKATEGKTDVKFRVTVPNLGKRSKRSSTVFFPPGLRSQLRIPKIGPRITTGSAHQYFTT